MPAIKLHIVEGHFLSYLANVSVQGRFSAVEKYHYLTVNAVLQEYALFVISENTKIAAA